MTVQYLQPLVTPTGMRIWTKLALRENARRFLTEAAGHTPDDMTACEFDRLIQQAASEAERLVHRAGGTVVDEDWAGVRETCNGG